MSQRRHKGSVAGLGVVLVGLVAAGCATPAETEDPSSTETKEPSSVGTEEAVQIAQRLVHLTTAHEETGMTLLEGPVIDTEQRLLVTDGTAPGGTGKVLAIDLEDLEADPQEIYTDDSSAITSAQFSPADGRLYLTDFAGGRILSLTPEGEDMEVVYEDEIDGQGMHPDDISFDQEGNMYVTDSSGYDQPYWEPSGRVIRIDADAEEATVLSENMPAPNGVAFTPDFQSLWISHNMSNQIDYLTLSPEGTSAGMAHPGIQVDGGKATVDSLAVDAEGHLYVGHHDRPAILVYNPYGELVQTIEADQEDPEVELSSATNLAIAEGTTEGYMTVSGDSGGYIYQFDALAEGIQQSNGG